MIAKLSKITPMTWFVILVIIAIGVALGLPPDPQALHQLHTTSTLYRLAVAALLIPYTVCWYASFYAFDKLQTYSRPLKNSKDGQAFNAITIGLGILAFGLIIPTITSLILNNIAVHNPNFKTPAIIINNYVGILVPLLSFLFISNGTRKLVHTVSGWSENTDLRRYAPGFILLGIIFSYLTLHNRRIANNYHLGLWWMIITFILPYLYAWLLGLISAFELHIYAKYVPGKLYRRPIRWIAYGIATAIGGSIAIQFINVTIANRVSSSLGGVLLLDYLLIVIVAVGLVLIAYGAKRLQRIEEA